MSKMLAMKESKNYFYSTFIVYQGIFFTMAGPSKFVKTTGSRFHTLIIKAYLGLEGFSDGGASD